MQEFCSDSGGANPGHLHVTGADGPASPREGKQWVSGQVVAKEAVEHAKPHFL